MYDVERAVSRQYFPLAPSGNMAVRREAALAVGGFDEIDADAPRTRLLPPRAASVYPGPIAYRPNAIVFHRSRPSDSELRRQASFYGEGVARLYLRYPEVLPWHLGLLALVAARTAGRAVLPLLLGAGRLLRRVPSNKLEFAVYDRLWTWWFWRGFLRFYYSQPRAAS